MPEPKVFPPLSEDCSYPQGLSAKEMEAIVTRRKKARLSEDEPKPDGPSSQPESAAVQGTGACMDTWRDDCVGLAISGGGIRSAIFSLGFLQALARNRLLRLVDFLSTVSGGSYIGAYLGRHYLRAAEFSESLAEEESGAPPAIDLVPAIESLLSDRRSPSVYWLRQNGRYLTPRGSGDIWVAVAAAIRDWLSVQACLAVLILACFYGLHAVDNLEYGLKRSDWLNQRCHSRLHSDHGQCRTVRTPEPAQTDAGPVEPSRGARVLAKCLDRWATAVSYTGVPLLAVSIVLVAFLLVYWPAVYFCHFIGDGPRQEAAKADVRRNITEVTSYLLILVVCLAAYRIVDTVGYELRYRYQDSGAIAAVVGWAAASMWAVANRVSSAATLLGGGDSKGTCAALRKPLLVGVGLLLIGVYLVLLAAFSYWSTEKACGLVTGFLAPRWISILLAGLCVALSLSWNRQTAFMNLTSLHALYTARLSRAFLGASNPKRWCAKGESVTAPLESDDIALTEYRPHEHGGPLHIINTTLNETVSGESALEFRDRKGLSVAVSALSLTVGVSHHALLRRADDDFLKMTVERLRRYGDGSFDLMPCATTEAEALSLGSWVSISGAAVSTGMGFRGSLGLSMVLAFLNLRLGYWWNSSMDPGVRKNRTTYTGSGNCLYAISSFFVRLFEMQSYLLNEYTGRFHGPARRYWNLTDGGHFENTATYELIRRQLPLIVCLDNGADPDYALEDLANLIRRVRTDFGAEIDFCSIDKQTGQAVWNNALDGTTDPLGNELSQLLKSGDGFLGDIESLHRQAQEQPSGCHAAIAVIRYASSGKRGLLLWVKPSLNDDEAQDLAEYHRAHPEFPSESTLDQSFDEAQWESYRSLGAHIGGKFSAAFGTRIPGLLAAVRPRTADDAHRVSVGPGTGDAAAKQRRHGGRPSRQREAPGVSTAKGRRPPGPRSGPRAG